MRKWQLWVGLLVSATLAAAGLSVAYSWWLAEPVRQVSAAQKQQVVRGPLQVSMKVYGRVAAPQPVVINPMMAGRLEELLVQEGDLVQPGQVIARLDDADLQAAIRGAEMALQTAQAQLARARAGVSAEYVEILEAALEAARARLLTAQATESGARANLTSVRQGATAGEIAIAQGRVEEARNVLWGAQAQRDAICGRVRVGIGQAECDSAEAAVGRAEESVRIAEMQVQQLQAGPSAATVSAAQAQLTAASGQVRAAEAQVAQAEAELQNALAGPRAEDIAVAAAQAAQAEFSLAEARRKQASVNIAAPSGGTVTSLGANVGQFVNTATPLVTLQDLHSLWLEALVNELYVEQVRPGQRALVRLEANPDQALEGRVQTVAMLPSLSAGLANYEVEIALPLGAAVRVGQNAEVEIVIENKAAALLVPRHALRLQGQEWAVQVFRQGKPTLVPVTVGAQQARWVEVSGDLAEGEELVTATTSLGTERGDYLWLPFGIMWRVD